MTPDDIRARVETVRQMAGDDEAAHSEEDDIHVSVLRAIAEGRAEDPAACAREALETLKLDFERWCG